MEIEQEDGVVSFATDLKLSEQTKELQEARLTGDFALWDDISMLKQKNPQEKRPIHFLMQQRSRDHDSPKDEKDPFKVDLKEMEQYYLGAPENWIDPIMLSKL